MNRNMSGYSDLITYLTDGLVVIPKEIQSIIIGFSDVPEFLLYYDRFLVNQDVFGFWEPSNPIAWIGRLRYSNRSKLIAAADTTLLDMYTSYRAEKYICDEKANSLLQPMKVLDGFVVYKPPYDMAEEIVLAYIKSNDAKIPMFPTFIGHNSSCDLFEIYPTWSVNVLYMPPEDEWNPHRAFPDMQYQDYPPWDPESGLFNENWVFGWLEQREFEREKLEYDLDYALEWSEYMGYEPNVYDKAWKN
jgi:hypothetical protein